MGPAGAEEQQQPEGRDPEADDLIAQTETARLYRQGDRLARQSRGPCHPQLRVISHIDLSAGIRQGPTALDPEVGDRTPASRLC